MSKDSLIGERQPPSSEMLRLIRDSLLQPLPPRSARIEVDRGDAAASQRLVRRSLAEDQAQLVATRRRLRDRVSNV